MPSLKEVRIRIASVKSTQQITSAMKMVAVSKLRRAQTAIIQLRPYAAKLKEILQNLSESVEFSDADNYSAQREVNRVLLIVVSSNRGLCGAFNANILKGAVNLIHHEYAEVQEKGNLYIMTIGRKASEFFIKRKYQVVSTHDNLFDNLAFSNIAPLAEKLMAEFAGKKYDKIEIIYNQFKSAAVQKLVVEQFLPVKPLPVAAGKKTMHKSDYIFEPSKELILGDLIPKSLKIQVYKVILDSFASEQGARMTAMHQATDNAQELIKELNLTYNKARQASITKEILEIVSGAEALKG